MSYFIPYINKLVIENKWMSSANDFIRCTYILVGFNRVVYYVLRRWNAPPLNVGGFGFRLNTGWGKGSRINLGAYHPSSQPSPLKGIAVRLSRVGWNKRSGSAKRERDIFKVRSTIGVHLESPFAGESLLYEDFFLPFEAVGFLLQGGCPRSWARRRFIVPYSLLVEPLRLFHPTVLRCAE